MTWNQFVAPGAEGVLIYFFCSCWSFVHSMC